MTRGDGDGDGDAVARAQAFGRLQAGLEVVMAGARSGRRHRELARRAGGELTRGEAQTLTRVVKFGPVRASALAELLDSDRSTTSRQVDVLVRGGLVERSVDPTDGRAHLLRATRRGRRLADGIRAQWAGLMSEVLTDWPAEKVDRLADLLAEFGDALARAPEE
ncbi:MarR family winged helix-turn-helix transcriptional regulator [Embleya scabrispora]|uniref:MarR family winged helix-turn-helix transcriptional regulator n=1 Tax=Embleya scabrispora TaxID=159449 RepID=UPI0003AA2ADF|nr:MarR family winged helix-turn-helix transcriptional regulator [Embleya scabrispora]